LNPINDDLKGGPHFLSTGDDLRLGELEAIVTGVSELCGEGVPHSKGFVPVVRGSSSRVKIGGVDWIEDGSMNLEESVASVDGQLLHLLIVLRVGTVVVAVGPEPQLRVGVEGVS